MTRTHGALNSVSDLGNNFLQIKLAKDTYALLTSHNMYSFLYLANAKNRNKKLRHLYHFQQK